MQIDTHNRDNNSSKFVPGPVPKAAQSPADADYSGLLECPCTNRLYKNISKTYSTRLTGSCGVESLWNSSDCFTAVYELTGRQPDRTSVIHDPSQPSGCTFDTSASNGDVTLASFNSLASANTTCGPAIISNGTATSGNGGVVEMSVSLQHTTSIATITLTGPATVWFGVAFNATGMGDLP